MPKIYVRKTDRQSWSKKAMLDAVVEVNNGEASLLAISKKYNVPEATLRRYCKKFKRGELSKKDFPQNAGRFKKTFSEKQIEELKQYIVDIDKRAFGLTKKQLGKLCFDYAESLGIDHRFNKEKKIAGKDFLGAFMQECNLTLRKPEATSVARLSGFNKPNVDKFFEALRDLRNAHSFEIHNIYNVHETGFSTVPTRNPKVISPLGTRRVIKLSSAERGTNVTCVCTMSAAGNFILPFFIFPRIRMNPVFMIGSPPGSDGIAHQSGWMTSEGFIKYLPHFLKFSRASAANPVLLLMDNHASHTTLEAVEFCRSNSIYLLGLPPHTIHRLQPLDVVFYGPLKSEYSVCCNDFMVSNPGRTITIREVASLVGTAYLRVAKAELAVKGFLATGIEPFNSAVFTEEDFAASLTTDLPQADSTSQNPTQPISSVGSPSLPSVENEDKTGEDPVVSHLPPLPFAKPKARRVRKKLPSFHLTGTPVKKALEEKKKKQEEKEEKRKAKQIKKKKKQQPKGKRKLAFRTQKNLNV